MAWTDQSKSKSERLRAVERHAFEAYNWFRRLGYRRAAALKYAGSAIGVTPRTLRSILYREPVANDGPDYDQVCRHFQIHLAERAAALAAELEAVNEELKRTGPQFEPDMGRHRETASTGRGNADLARS